MKQRGKKRIKRNENNLRDLWEKVECPNIKIRASLIAQLVKNLPAMQETLVQFLGWEDLLENG